MFAVTGAKFVNSWKGLVRTAIKNPGTTLHVFLGNAEGGFVGMATRGFEPDAIATEQEMSYIARAVANGQRSWDSVNFYDSEGDQLERPTEPNWPVDFPRTDPEEGLGGLP